MRISLFFPSVYTHCQVFLFSKKTTTTTTTKGLLLLCSSVSFFTAQLSPCQVSITSCHFNPIKSSFVHQWPAGDFLPSVSPALIIQMAPHLWNTLLLLLCPMCTRLFSLILKHTHFPSCKFDYSPRMYPRTFLLLDPYQSRARPQLQLSPLERNLWSWLFVTLTLFPVASNRSPACRPLQRNPAWTTNEWATSSCTL